MKRGRIMWLSSSGSTATEECVLHMADKLKKCGYTPGVYFTESELRDELKAAFEAGPSTLKRTFDEWYDQHMKEGQ